LFELLYALLQKTGVHLLLVLPFKTPFIGYNLSSKMTLLLYIISIIFLFFLKLFLK
jgi:uncharacterized membrane protein